jgi:hypothetical protein
MTSKTIHFEDVWVAAEKSCEARKLETDVSIKCIQESLSHVKENPEYYLGQILMHVSNLSNYYKVNTWQALQVATTDNLVDFYEP